MNKTALLFFFMLMWLVPGLSHAQIDPTLTAMIIEYTQKAKSQYNTQMTTMALETEGHVWLKQEVEETKNYQQQFDQYISTFRGILAYAAQVYGFYYEINHLSENMGKLTQQIGETPVNAIAVALHKNRNDIYVNIINQSIGIVNTIRQVCIDTKMTEKQRAELVFTIRPQLQNMNHQLAMLTKLVRCTTMAQVWYAIEQKAIPHRDDKAGIVEECLNMWRVNARASKSR